MTTKTNKPPAKNKQRDLISSIERGFKVLRAFDQHSIEMTPAEVANRIQVPRAATRRVLLTLCELGYAISDGKHFRLSPKVLDLAHGYLAKTRVRDLIEPMLQATTSELHDSCVISVREGVDSLAILCCNSSGFGAVNVNAGMRIPLYVSAPGRLLLSGSSTRELADYLAALKIRKFTQHTVTNKAELREQILKIREQGFAFGREEFELGVYAVAVPVRNIKGHTIAALTCIGNVAKITTDDAMHSRVELLTKAAQRMSNLLPDDPGFSLEAENGLGA